MPEQAELQQDQAAQNQQTKPGKPQGNGNGADETPESSASRKFIIGGVILLIILIAGFFYWRSTFTEDTDDAQVDGNLYQVSSRVTGQVLKVYVEENQTVQVGQALVEIDPRDYQVAVEQAEANLAQAQAQYAQATVNVPITTVSVKTTITTSGSDVLGSTASVAQAQKQVQVAEAQVAQAQANIIKAQLDVDPLHPPLVPEGRNLQASNIFRRRL